MAQNRAGVSCRTARAGGRGSIWKFGTATTLLFCVIWEQTSCSAWASRPSEARRRIEYSVVPGTIPAPRSASTADANAGGKLDSATSSEAILFQAGPSLSDTPALPIASTVQCVHGNEVLISAHPASPFISSSHRGMVLSLTAYEGARGRYEAENDWVQVGVRSLGTTLAASVQLTVSGGDNGRAVATCVKDHCQAPKLKYAWDGAFKEVRGGRRARVVPEKTISTASHPGEYRSVPAPANV